MTVPPPDRRDRFTAFTRDVLVNVLANLIAAALGYLLGVAGGVFKGNDLLVQASRVAVAVGVALLLILVAAVHRDERSAAYLIVASIVVGAAATATALLIDFGPAIVRIPVGVAGTAVFGLGIHQLFQTPPH